MKNIHHLFPLYRFLDKRFVFQDAPKPGEGEKKAPTPAEAIKSKSQEFKDKFKAYEGKTELTQEEMDALKKLDANALAQEALTKIQAEAGKKEAKGPDNKPLPEIATALADATRQINETKDKMNHLVAFSEYKAQVSVLDVDKEKCYKDLKTKLENYKPENAADLLATRKAMEGLLAKYKKLNDSTAVTDDDKKSLKVNESIGDLTNDIPEFAKYANDYYTDESDRVDTLVGYQAKEAKSAAHQEGQEMTLTTTEIKFKSDSIKLSENFAQQEGAEKVRSGNMYFSQLNTMRGDIVSAKDECAQLLVKVDGDPLVSPETKADVRKRMKGLTDMLDAELKKVDARIASMSKDGVSVSADYLKEKRDAEKQVLTDTLQESGKWQAKLVEALNAIDPNLKTMPAGPEKDAAMKAAYSKVDTKIYDQATAAYNKYLEQQKYYDSLGGVKGDTTVIPGTLDYTAANAELAKLGDQDPHKVRPDDADKGKPGYNAKYSSYIDRWYATAADKKVWPPKSATENKNETDRAAADSAKTDATAKFGELKAAVDKNMAGSTLYKKFQEGGSEYNKWTTAVTTAEKEPGKAKPMFDAIKADYQALLDKVNAYAKLPAVTMDSAERNRLSNQKSGESITEKFYFNGLDGKQDFVQVTVHCGGIANYDVEGTPFGGDFTKLYSHVESLASQRRYDKFFGAAPAAPQGNAGPMLVASK